MNKPHKKPRLMQMPQAHIDLLAKWLTEDGITYERALPMVKAQFGVTVSAQTLCAFYKNYCGPLILAKGKASLAPVSIITAGVEIVIDASQPGIVRLILPPGVTVERAGK